MGWGNVIEDFSFPRRLEQQRSKVHSSKSVQVGHLERKVTSWNFTSWRLGLWRVPGTAKRSIQSILKEINPEYSFRELMLKLLYLGHLMRRADSLEKTQMLGKVEGRRGWQRMNGWMALPTQWTWVWASSRSWRWTGKPGVLQSMGLVGHDWATELDWDAGPPQCRGSLAYTRCSGSFANSLCTSNTCDQQRKGGSPSASVSLHTIARRHTYTQEGKHGLGNSDHRPLWAAAPISTKPMLCPPISQNYSRTFIKSPNLPTLTKLYHFTCCTIYLLISL